MDISWCLNFYHSLYIKPHSVLGVPTKVAFLVHILFCFMRIWFFKQWRFLECICMPVATKFLFHAILFFCSDCGVFSMKNFVPQFHSQYILYYLSRKSSQLVSLSFTMTGAHQFHNQFYLNMNTPQLVSL